MQQTIVARAPMSRSGPRCSTNQADLFASRRATTYGSVELGPHLVIDADLAAIVGCGQVRR